MESSSAQHILIRLVKLDDYIETEVHHKIGIDQFNYLTFISY